MPNNLLATDQMGFGISLKQVPTRIVSLVPSQTEFLFDLGLEGHIVGITKFCIHPEEKCKGKARIGGTKKFNFEILDSLHPDLIIGNKEENYQEGIEQLKLKYPVWMSDITTLEQALEMMHRLGTLLNKRGEAEEIISKIKNSFKRLAIPITKRALYFIWKEPYMAVGKDTFIDEMLHKCGLENVLKERSRYPVLSVEEIAALDPDIILLSSEPYPFQEKHVEEFLEICPHSQIVIVDGELFSWYGSRLQYSAAYFKEIAAEWMATDQF